MLSIAICHMPERARLLRRLLDILEPQAAVAKNAVEIVVDSDDAATIGDKRQRLLLSVKGQYVTFIDDDDVVSADYVSAILAAIDKGKHPDCIGIEGRLITPSGKQYRFVHSITCAGWYRAGDTYYRWPNHISPVLRELALLTGYMSLSHGEDYDYSCRLRPLLRTETLIPQPIYIYLARHEV